ncbi:MAG: preprotein translocase subunit SecA, partial [bacterium]
QWDLEKLDRDVKELLNLDLPVADWAREEGIDDDAVRERLTQAAAQAYASRAANVGPVIMRQIEKSLLLQIFDQSWKEHLLSLDHLRQGIGLRAYGQRDPLNEYKSEAFRLFNSMLENLRERVNSLLLRIEIRPDAPPPAPEGISVFDMRHPDPTLAGAEMME